MKEITEVACSATKGTSDQMSKGHCEEKPNDKKKDMQSQRRDRSKREKQRNHHWMLKLIDNKINPS